MYRYFRDSSFEYNPGPSGTRRFVAMLLLTLLLGLLNWSLDSGPVRAIYSAAGLTPPGMTEPRVRTWKPGVVYMQVGPSCVGYALAAWLDAEPRSAYNHPSGLDIYEAAQKLDGIRLPHDGTTVGAGLEVLARMGFTGKWQSTQDADKTLDFLRTAGPVVLDSDFPQERPVFDDEKNLVWTGRMARHAWLCYGVDGQDRLTCQNSSGTNAWNKEEGGRFHMSRIALVKVLLRGLAWLISKA